MPDNEEAGGDVEQVKAENAALKSLLEQQKNTIEKHEGLISTLRKIESRSKRSETIVKDAVAALRQGIPEQFLKIAETLPIETQWEMYKAFPRQDSAPHVDEESQETAVVGPTQITAAPATPARPVAPQIESPLEREKAQMKAAGTLNMHSMLQLIKKYNST